MSTVDARSQATPSQEDSCVLRSLLPEDETRFRPFAREYAATGDHRYTTALDDFPGFLARLRRAERREKLPAGRVPGRAFWLFAGAEIIGGSRLRYELNADLEQVGGHIGYDVRPSERMRGFGNRILHETLAAAREIPIDRVLVTCDSDNHASRRIIEKNGGVLGDRVLSPEGARPILRFWIDNTVPSPPPAVPAPLLVRALASTDREATSVLLGQALLSPDLISAGEGHDALAIDGLVIEQATESGGRDPLGVALYRVEVPRARLIGLAVGERRRGLGRRLVAEVAELCQRAGARGLGSMIPEENDEAQVFFAACGFRHAALHERPEEGEGSPESSGNDIEVDLRL